MDLLIGKSGEREFFLEAQELVTGRTCIIAQSGAGKSWAIAVICERLCRNGVGFCIIDTEGEYCSLKDKYDLLWIGSDKHADLDIDRVRIHEVMLKAVRNNTAVIFDVSESEMRDRVSELAEALYEIESEVRIPYLLIVEEADKFIPQSHDSLKRLEEISRRGRKRGLGFLVATQRPSLVNKNVLSQCNNQIIGKLSIENDLRAVDLFFSSRKEVEELTTLEPGEFFVMGKISPRKTRISFDPRETEHRGSTPRLSPKQVDSTAPPKDKTPEVPVTDSVRETVPMTGQEKLTFTPLISRDRALEIAERSRKKGFLGRNEEHLASLDLVQWPIILVKVRYLGGLLHRTPKEASFLIEGRGARVVGIQGGLALRGNLSPLIGLSAEDVRIFRHLSLKGTTIIDLEAQAGLPQSVIRGSLRRLIGKKLVTDGGMTSSARLYMPLVRLRAPRFSSIETIPEQSLTALTGEAKECTIQENEIRSVLKGFEPTMEILSWMEWYYPVYEIVYSLGRSRRLSHLDGMEGNIVSFLE
ncbi:MAG: DUF87 domain-containing protein [Methanomicrobiales archaeon]|nr:DUF87 domain-containing protein [Methanomicrobiales archaeon]